MLPGEYWTKVSVCGAVGRGTSFFVSGMRWRGVLLLFVSTFLTSTVLSVLQNIILSAGDGCTRHAGETDVSQNCGVPGVCGDRFETHGDSRPVSSDVNSACPSKATWTEGQTISLEIAVGTNHGGLWNVNVCPCTSCDDSDLTQSCFNENRLISCAPHLCAL